MERFALVGAPVFDGTETREVALVVADGRVEALCAPDDLPAGVRRVDLPPDRLVAPGFIDLQINGGGGVLFNDAPTVAGIRAIGAAHRRFGTTGFLPTLISDRPEVTRAALAAVREALASRVPGVLGIHVEGPHLAAARRGVHRAEMLRPMDEADLAVLCAQGGVTLTTVAPEVVTREQIAALARAGVRVFLGHSDAEHATAAAAFAAGACGVTHLFNAMSPLASRAPGMVGAALDHPRAVCGLIVDGLHVDPASLRVALAAKPRGTCVLVSDAMPPVGTDAASFALQGETIFVRAGRLVTADGTLAGAALDMAAAVRNAVALLGLPVEEALRMAAAYPADALGLGRTHGRLLRGYRADVVVLAPDLAVERTWIGGEEAPHS